MRASGALIAGITLLFLAPPAFGKCRRSAASCGDWHRSRPVDDAPRPEADDFDLVLREAQNAYIDGAFEKAMALAQPPPGADARARQRAWRLTGAAACNLRDVPRVKSAYRRLEDPNARLFIIYVCQRNGVIFKGRDFRLDPEYEGPDTDDAPETAEVPDIVDIPDIADVPATAIAQAAAPPARSLDGAALFAALSALLIGSLLGFFLRRRATLSAPPP